MMDFNLILLLVGVGLLVLVAIFALLGFFAGLKKELKCTAIAFVLLLLALLVFGESSTLLNASSEVLKVALQDVPASAETIWDYVVYLVQTKVPNGTEIFVEGTKSYAFLYDVVGGVARGAMLLVGTLGMFIIILITNGIFRLVTRIVSHSKAKRRAKAGIKEPVGEPDKNIADNVLVAQSAEGEMKGTVIVAKKTPAEVKKSNHRGWSAFIAGVRAIIVILFLFAPISGICSVLDEISPETEKLINETLSGGNQQTAASDTALDIALDFKDAYYDSAIGKFVESSAFFFGDSISTHLFDDAFTIKTATSEIEIRDEVLVVIDAVNALEGNTKFDSLTDAQLSGALDALKDSELLVEAMPVAIEVVYELPIINNDTLSNILAKAGQQTAFLQLRQANWDKNLEILFDTVKEAYKLGILEEDFNYLTMDPQVLRQVVNTLTESDVVTQLLNIAVKTALKLEQVTNLVGNVGEVDLSSMDWAADLGVIVDIYDTFQELEITTLENLDTNQLISDVLNDQVKFDIVADIVSQVFSLQLVKNVALDVAFNYIANNKYVTDAGFNQTTAVKQLAELDWESDIESYLLAVKTALPLLDFSEGLTPTVDYLHLDVVILQEVVDLLFATESFEKILPIGANVALALPAVQKLVGEYKVTIDTSKIDWKQDFTTLVSIYEDLLELDIDTIETVTKDTLGFVKSTFNDDNKVVALKSIVTKLANLDLFVNIGGPVAESVVKQLVTSKGLSTDFANLINLKLTAAQWEADLTAVIELAEQVNVICGFDFALASIEFTEEGFAAAKEALQLALNLNLLGDDNFKNTLVIEALKLTKVFADADIEAMDLSNVQWLEGEHNELANLQALLDAVFELQTNEGIDLNNLKFDYNKLLNSEEFMDDVVTALEAVVDSNLILEVIPAALNKFVIPQIEKFDDEDSTLNDLISNLDSKELVVEVQKLVDAVKAAIKVGVFKVASEGIEVLDLSQTDALRDIINGIFDCSLIEGYESRIIRIVLKVTKVFPDLEKDALDGIDFDREQELLIKAIDELEVVLQDEKFFVFEDGKLQLDKEFYTRETTLNAALSALAALFGEYTPNTETQGSELIERLLPVAYDKYAESKIPANFKELTDILGFGELEAEALVSDIRRIFYVAKVAVDMKVQSFVTENDYDFTNALEGINEILDTVFGMNSIVGNEGAALAWALNYVQETAKLDIASFTEADFADVDWTLEVDNLQAVIAEVIEFTDANFISSVNKLISFIQNKGYLEDAFLNDANADLVFNIIEGVFNLQIVESILPFGLEYALKLAQEKNYDVTFLGENMTGELLVEDLMKVVDALKIAVYDLDILEYKKANWTGPLPAIDPVIEIIDIILRLNLLDGKENQLVKYVIETFLPANEYLKASDFDYSEKFSASAEWNVMQEVLKVAYQLLEANNLDSIEDVKAFVEQQQYTSISNLLTNENLLIIADILELLDGSQLAQQALVGVIDNAVELENIKKYGDFSALKKLTKAELASDLNTLATVVRLAVEANLIQYYHDKDLAPINYSVIASILETVGSLNLVNKCASSVLPEVLNYVLDTQKTLNIDYKFTSSDFETINWSEEFVIIGNTLVELGDLFENINLDSLADVIQFVKNGDFTNKIVTTTENANLLLEALDILVESQLVPSIAVAGVDYVIELAANKGYDISFLDGMLTAKDLANDLGVIAQILHDVVDFGAVDYLQNGDINPLEFDYLVHAISLLEELNVLTSLAPQWTLFVADLIVKKANLNISVAIEDYHEIDFAKENELLQAIVKEVAELLGNENLTSISEIKEFVNNKFYGDINAYNAAAIENVQNILTLAVESEIVGVHLVDFLELGADIASQKLGMDLTFVKGVFTSEEIAEDVLTLVEMSDYLIEAGLIEIIFDNDVEINVDPIVEVVKLLEEVNILRKCNQDIAVLVYNMILPKLGIDAKVHKTNVMNIDFAKENELLQVIVKEVGKLLENEGLYTVYDVCKFIDIKEFANKDSYQEVYNAEAIDIIEKIVTTAVSSKLVQLRLIELFNKGIDVASEKLDISFMKDSVTISELVEDVPVLFDVVDYLVEFGVLELVFTKDLAVINLAPVIDAIALFEDLNILVNNNQDLTAFAFNQLTTRLGVDFVAAASDFDGINYADENKVLRNALETLSLIQAEFNLVSLADFKDFVNNKKFADFNVYTQNVYAYVEKLVNEATESKILQYALPVALEFGTNKLAGYDLDLTFLNGLLTGEQLASDLRILVKEGIWWLQDGELLKAINEKVIREDYIERLAETLNTLEQVNLLNVSETKLVVALTNYVAKNVLKYDGQVNEEYFASITNWNEESDKLQIILKELSDIVVSFGVDNNLLSLTNLQEFIAGGYKNNVIVVNTDKLATDLADVLEATSQSTFASAELVFVHEYLASYLSAHAIDIAYTVVDTPQLQVDLATLANAIDAAVLANAIDFVLKGEALDQTYVEDLANAVVDILNMNVLAGEGNREHLIITILSKLGVNVSYQDLYPIDWNTETANIKAMLLAANDLLVALGLNTINDIKAVNIREYLYIGDETNQHLEAVADVLEAVVSSQLVEKLVLPLSEKYLTNANLAGFADLHNIYVDGTQVTSDIVNLIDVINALIALDLNNFMNDNGEIPYENTEAINSIIRNVFSLNYLNNDGRLDTLLAKVSGIDTSSIDTSKIDLVGDAEKLVEMYGHLLTILGDEAFFIQTKEDLKAYTIYVKYWVNDKFIDAAKEALRSLYHTTLVQETNGAIFLLALPLLQKAAPDIYEALDVERLTVDDLSEDFEVIADIAKKVFDADLKAILNGSYFTNEVEELLTYTIEQLSNLNLLAGRGSALANCFATRYDCKVINGYEFYASDYNFDDINYYEDAQVLVEIIHVLYDFFERKNIETIDELTSYISNFRTNLRSELSDEANMFAGEQVLEYLTELTFVEYNGLAVYNLFGEKLVAKYLSSELADLDSVYADSFAFHQDLVIVSEIVAIINDLGFASVMAGNAIDFNQADLVKALLDKVVNMEYANEKLVPFVEFVDSKVAMFDLSSIDFEAMDLANDLPIVGEIYEQLIPVLLSEHNPFQTVDAIKAATINKSDLYALIYDYQSIYPSVVELATNITIAPQVVKLAVEKVANTLSGTAGSVVNVLDIPAMDDAELREDLVVLADILRQVETLDLLRYVLYKEDVTITDNATISALAANVFNLHMIDNNFIELVEKTISKVLNVNLDSVDFTSIDVEKEQELLVELVNDGVVVANSLGVDYVTEINPYVSTLISSVKEDVKEAIQLLKDKELKAGIKALVDTLLDEARKVNGEASVQVVEQLCESELFAKIVLPIYEQKVYTKLDGILAMVGDIHDYSEEQLTEDLALVARIVRNLLNSGIQTVATDRVLPAESCITYLEEVVRDVCHLNILDVKKQDLGPVLQAILDRVGLTEYIRKIDKDFDLAKYDGDSLNFAGDADTYASMVGHAYVVLEGLLETGFNASIFGNTEAVNALVEIYTIAIETNLADVVAPKVLNSLTKLAAKFKCTVNENDQEVLYNISEFLFGLIELGVFSNDGIDLTKTDVIDAMVQNVYDSVTLPSKLQRLVDVVVGRIYAYGVVPFDWTQISVRNEAKVALDVAKLGIDFAQANAAKIKDLDLSFLADKEAQADLTEIATILADSSFVEQLFFPFVEGTFNALTLSYTDGEMNYTATLDDVLATSLPNFWKVMDAVNVICGFKPSNINKNSLLEFEAIADIVEVFGTDIMLKDNVAKLITTFIGRFTGHDLNKEEIAALEAIDYEVEVQYALAALAKLQETYDATSFELNVEAIKNSQVLIGLAEALEAVLPSETLKVLAKKVITVVNNRIVEKVAPQFAQVVRDHLADEAYTNELVVEDMKSLVSILKDLANSNALANLHDFTKWNYSYLRDVVTLCFATNIAKGYEADFAEAIIVNVPQVRDYYNDSIVVSDWEKEAQAILNALESLVNDGVVSLDKVDVDQLSGTTLDYVCDSVVLSTVVADKMNEELAELDLDAYYYVEVEDFDMVTNWQAELDAIKVLIDLMNALDSDTYVLRDIVDQYRQIQSSTVLMKDIVDSSASYIVPKMPVVSEYYSSSITIEEWSNELKAIVDTIDLLEQNSFTNIYSPIENLNGEIIITAFSSEILSEAFEVEFNKNLTKLELTYQVTSAELEEVKTAAEWDVELAAILEVEALMNKYESATLSEVKDLYNKVVNDTYIAEKVLVTALLEKGLDLDLLK